MDDSADEDDMFKIDVPEDRRKMTREERLQAARLRADKQSPKRRSKASNKSRTPTKDQKPKPPSSDDIDKEADAAPRARGIQRTPNLSNMKEFVMAPARRRDGVVQCYIERIKPTGMASFGFGSTQYHLYLKENDTFLMAAKPRKANKTSNYLISISKDDLARKSDNYVGKLRSNFLGTEFNVYDDGMNPNSGDKTSGSNKIREELGIAMYASNLLGSRGPRKMRVAVPVVDERTQRRVKFQPRTDEEGILRKFKDRELDQLFYMINKPPRWNDQVGAYVLNFNGRVTMASVKNFQLINPEDQERVVLQFGRVAKDKFTMDFQSPLSPFQAFAISLSSFDSKLACE